MVTIPSLFADALWILGLSGVLATFSYLSWERSLRRWNWKDVLVTPRFLTPFCLSLALFCTGMALNAATNPTPSWWQIAAWSVLAVVFALYCANSARAARRNGWDAPIEGNRQP